MARMPKVPKRPKDLDDKTLAYVNDCLNYQRDKLRYDAGQSGKDGNYETAAKQALVAEVLDGNVTDGDGNSIIEMITSTID